MMSKSAKSEPAKNPLRKGEEYKDRHTFLQSLASRVPGLYSPGDSDRDLPSISQPIDQGATDLLTKLSVLRYEYPPLEVEYLVRTLNEHLRNCQQFRTEGQDLEVKAIGEAMSLQLESAILLETQKLLSATESLDPQLLGNMVKARINENEITGEQARAEDWMSAFEPQYAQLSKRLDNVNARIDQLGAPGTGTNYAERFAFIKDLFKIDLSEAYIRAEAIAVGLKHVYGINKPIPAISDVGYLNKLIHWAREVTYALEKATFQLTETTLSFNLQSASKTDWMIFDATEFVQKRATHKFQFELSERHFAGLQDPRLRGIALDVVCNASQKRYERWRCKVSLPGQTVQYSQGPKAWIPYVKMSATSFDSPHTEKTVGNQREAHNVRPLGLWTIEFDARSEGGFNVVEFVDNVTLRLKLVYRHVPFLS